MVAPRINEHGMMTMGLVGRAKYGCGGAMTGGLFVASGGLCDRLLDMVDFDEGVGTILVKKNFFIDLPSPFRTKLTLLAVCHCNNVAYEPYTFWC